MKTLTKKQAILQSLERMDSSEMDKVLDYIKGFIYNPENDRDYKQIKQKAMQQIRKALKNDNGQTMIA